MHPLSFGSKKFAEYLKSLDQEGLKRLLEIAVNLIQEEYHNDSRIQEAVGKWKARSDWLDEEYSHQLQNISRAEDEKYLHLERTGAEQEVFEKHYRLMFVFSGFSQLFQLTDFLHNAVYDILYDFSVGAEDFDQFIHNVESQMRAEIPSKVETTKGLKNITNFINKILKR